MHIMHKNSSFPQREVVTSLTGTLIKCYRLQIGAFNENITAIFTRISGRILWGKKKTKIHEMDAMELGLCLNTYLLPNYYPFASGSEIGEGFGP